MAIGPTVAEIWGFFDFSKWWPSAILDFFKVTILRVDRVKRPNMRFHTNFRPDRSNGCSDMVIFKFLKMAAAAILDFRNL